MEHLVLSLIDMGTPTTTQPKEPGDKSQFICRKFLGNFADYKSSDRNWQK